MTMTPRYWTLPELHAFMVEHDLIIPTGIGGDYFIITGRGSELLSALQLKKDFEEAAATLREEGLGNLVDAMLARAFEKFPDQWIAMRAGTVVAVADSEEELEQDPDVEPTDVRYYVPPAGHM